MTVYEDFTAGIATQAPRLVATHSKKFAGLRGASKARNVVVDELGVRTGPGYARIFDPYLPAAIRGLHWYVRRSSGSLVEQMLAVSDGDLYYNTTLDWTAMSAGLTDAPKTRFVTFNGYAIFANGVDVIKQYDGSSVASVSFVDDSNVAVTTPDVAPVDDARPTFMFVHQNRVFYLGDPVYPYRLWTPNAGTHNVCGANADVIDVNVGDGDPLVGGSTLTTGVAVLFKENSIHALSGTNPTDATTAPFVISPVSRELGCIAPDTIVAVGAEVYFLSQRGFKRLKYTTVTGNITDADPLHAAQPILDTLDLTRASQANACFNPIDRMIYLSIPIKGGGWTTLTYNVVTEGIMQRDLELTNQIFVASSGLQFFSRVEDDAQTEFRVFQNNVGRTFDGVDFSSEWESLYLATDQMNTRKFFGKFLAYTRTYNGSKVRCGARLVLPDGTVSTRLLDFGDTSGQDVWDIGQWDVANWDGALASVLRQSRIGRGVAISLFFQADAGASFFFDRIELEIDNRGPARR